MAFDSYPYIFLHATGRAGKTRSMEIIAPICFNSLIAASISDAAMYRSIENDKCTIFHDEAAKYKMKKHLLSPIGEPDYPHLVSPDTKFSPKGKYGVSLVLDPHIPEHAEYLKKIEELARTKVGAGALVPIRDHKDSDGNPTGEKVVKYTSSFAPKLYDKFNKPLENKMIGQGSVIQVAAVPNAYKNVAGHSGINLYLVAVKITEIVEPVGSGAESFGFIPEAAEDATAKTEEPKPFFVESTVAPF